MTAMISWQVIYSQEDQHHTKVGHNYYKLLTRERGPSDKSCLLRSSGGKKRDANTDPSTTNYHELV